MNLFNPSYLLAAFLTCYTSDSFSMKAEESPESLDKASTLPSSDPEIEALKGQLIKVKAFIEDRKEKGLSPAQMVLGARNREIDLEIGRFIEGNWIFFDMWDNHDPAGAPYLRASFMDLEHLKMIAAVIGPSLEKIIFDDRTYKFAFLDKGSSYQGMTLEHLKQFYDMLKPGGKFIFSPSGIEIGIPKLDENGTEPESKVMTDKELLDEHVRRNPFSDAFLPMIHYFPSVECTEEDKKDPQALRRIKFWEEITEKMKDSSEEDYFKYLDKMPDIVDEYPFEVIKNNWEYIIKQEVREAKLERLRSSFSKDFYNPHITKVLKTCFDEIEVKEKQPYPIPSKYLVRGPDLYTVMICKKSEK